MIEFLRGLFGRRRREGFLLERNIPLGAMTDDRPGARIANSHRGPPYMPVYHDIRRVRPPLWPDRLWRVRILKPASGRAVAEPDTHYIHARAVEIVEEVPASRIFGAHGEAVAALIELAKRMDPDMAARLAAARHSQAGAVYSRVWRRWIALNLPSSPHRDIDHEGTLKVVGGDGASPVNEGLAMIHGEAFHRAEQACGRAAFHVDDDDDAVLNPPWNDAAQALLEAALARGAPELLEDGEREILDAAVSSVR